MFKVKHQSDRCSGVFVVNFERISHLFTVDVEQVNVCRGKAPQFEA